MHAPYYSEQEMSLERVCVVGHLVSFWQRLKHQVPYKPDSTHEQLEEGEEEVEAMQGLEVLLSLPVLDPTQPELPVSTHNEILTY